MRGRGGRLGKWLCGANDHFSEKKISTDLIVETFYIVNPTIF
jgi:hypothetical protein